MPESLGAFCNQLLGCDRRSIPICAGQWPTEGAHGKEHRLASRDQLAASFYVDGRNRHGRQAFRRPHARDGRADRAACRNRRRSRQGLGAFQTLHGYQGPKPFAEALTAAGLKHHGHAAPAFLKHIAQDLAAILASPSAMPGMRTAALAALAPGLCRASPSGRLDVQAATHRSDPATGGFGPLKAEAPSFDLLALARSAAARPKLPQGPGWTAVIELRPAPPKPKQALKSRGINCPMRSFLYASTVLALFAAGLANVMDETGGLGLAASAPIQVLIEKALCEESAAAPKKKWVTAWTASAQGPYPSGFALLQPDLSLAFPDPGRGADDQSFRMIVRPDLWGGEARIRLSNAFGLKPVRFDRVFIGLHFESSAVAADSNRPVTFGGKDWVEVPPGQDAWSDAAALPFVPEDDAARFLGRKLAVIDFDAATVNAVKGALKSEYAVPTNGVSKQDGLHPNRAGYLAMGASIDLDALVRDIAAGPSS